MIWFVVLTMLLFEGLAVCTIGGMVMAGFGAGLAVAVAVFELAVGVTVVRAMRRDIKRI